MKEFKRVVVIVHPHFAIPRLKYKLPQTLREVMPSDANAQQLKLAAGNAALERMLASRDFLHRFYKREIDRAKKTPGTLVVILTSRFSDLLDSSANPNFEADALAKKNGIARETAGVVFNRLQSQQAELLNYARKLGRRLAVMPREYENLPKLGNLLENHFRENGVRIVEGAPVEVFGEYTNVCVNAAHESLVKIFPQARIVYSKSQPHAYY